MTLRAGQVVGNRWLLGRELGHGAFGQVFAADDQSAVSLGQAAIKVMHPSTSPREREAFHDEIRKVVALRHQNLVAYLDSGEYIDEGGSAHLYLVTELCQYSLQDWLDGARGSGTPGGLAPDQTERLLNDMAAGLGYLHGRGTLHRDLKPGNVLLGGADWKLADFGLSRDMSATGHYHHGDTLMGTPRYMAPELFNQGAAAPAADVYAVGVTLHQALTGRPVHDAGSDMALILAITTQPPSIEPSLPPEWRHLIGRCLDRDPARRPAAAELPAALATGRNDGGAGNLTLPVTGLAGAGSAAGYQSAPVAPYTAPAGDRGPDGFTRPVPFEPGRKPGPGRGLVIGAAAAVAAVAVLGGALALANRGGGDDTATGDTTAASTGDSTAGSVQNGADPATTVSTGTAGGAGTTADPAAVAAAAQKKVAAITPVESDAPNGYTTLLDPPGSNELCTGVQPLRLAKPPLVISSVEFDSTAQYFLPRAMVYDSVESAQAAFTYAAGLAAACDNQPLGADSPGQVWDITPDPAVVLEAADQTAAAQYATLGGSVSSVILTIYAQIGDTVVQVSGSDRATTVYYAELILARATGQTPPVKVQPKGAVGDLGGGNAGNVRQLLNSSTDANPGTKDWLANHTNVDIDIVAASACLALNASDTPAQLGGELLASYDALDPAVRGNLSSDDYGQLAGTSVVLYCPEDASRLGLA